MKFQFGRVIIDLEEYGVLKFLVDGEIVKECRKEGNGIMLTLAKVLLGNISLEDEKDDI